MAIKRYITTPIYYVNDVPHIGHAYTTVAADILARFYRLKGDDVFFLTGTDEHGQKVEQAAAAKGMTAKAHADIMVENFRSLWKTLNISNDNFIRTTDAGHIEIVQQTLQALFNKGEIVKRSYSGWYCTPDERFWTEKDLNEGNCPDCGRPVEEIQEENYFFLMSKYQKRLISYIEENPSYILPETRRNEVLGFLNNNELGDLCISRPKSRLAWGIPLPFDKDFVTYVWFDALLNYYSATKYLAPETPNSKPLTLNSSDWWPASHHLVGKDILTTHAVYWSTMLMALNDIDKITHPDSNKFSLPKNIFAHGWWTVEGKKMSKSVGNVVDPNELASKYGVDAFRYFLFREVPFGLDGNYSEDALINRINTELANDLGNLLSRFMTMAEKFFNGTIEKPLDYSTEFKDFPRNCINAMSEVVDDTHKKNWSNLRFNIILDHIWDVVRAANNHIAQTEPWKLAKDDQAQLKDVMFDLWNALRLSALALYPFMPETSEKMWKQLGLKSLTEEAGDKNIFTWNWKPGYGIKVSKGEQLFPRIEVKKVKSENEKIPLSPPFTKGDITNSPTLEKPTVGALGRGQGGFETDNLISIEDFVKVQLKIGKVLEAERVPKSNKLIKLQIDTGEQRQVVAGIGQVYAPEDLVGKKIVVVTNLKPAKLMGVESNGMLLAATDSEGVLSILMPDKDIKEGAKIK